jgi:predicted DNA-binding transcriptional regulator AlpA
MQPEPSYTSAEVHGQNPTKSELAEDRFSQHRLLTISDVAHLFAVPPSWVYSHTRARAGDRIPGFRLGRYWRFKEAEIVKWLDHHGQ